MSELTSLSLTVTQSLIFAAFSSMTFASWVLTKICFSREIQIADYIGCFIDINGHFCGPHLPASYLFFQLHLQSLYHSVLLLNLIGEVLILPAQRTL